MNIFKGYNIVIISMLSVSVLLIILFGFIHITWDREEIGYAIPLKSLSEALKEHTTVEMEDTSNIAVKMEARYITAISPKAFPLDDEQVKKNRSKIIEDDEPDGTEYIITVRLTGSDCNLDYKVVRGD
mgnify:CR=1 FL=1